jgi:diguanylate cyclase (GGDEF)-like protein/PAS domain S-box-containing protein
MRTPPVQDPSPAPVDALRPVLDDLLAGAVRRVGAAAACFVPADGGELLEGPRTPDQALLSRVLPALLPAVDQVRASCVARYQALPADELPATALAGILALRGPAGEALGCVVALRREGWPAAERIALGCLLDAAAAALACRAEAQARRDAEDRVRLLEEALRAVDLGVTITDADGCIVYVNAAEARMHGYRPEDLYGREARAFAPPELWASTPGVPRSPRGSWARERTNIRRDGTRFPVRLRSEPILDEQARPVGMVTWCEDLSERAPALAEGGASPGRDSAGGRADPLTGVLERAAFLHHLREACAARDGDAGSPFAVLFVDLDRFKSVNDRHGHTAGDALLSLVGRRLTSCVRPQDTVGRVGGDEFAVILRGIAHEADAIPVVHRIQRTLGAAATLGDVEVHPSASVGVAFSPACETPEGLLASADRAMYRAKALGPGQVGAADLELHTHDAAVAALEADLRRAVLRDELALRFQPIVELADRRLVGFEALVRWNHPTRGLLGPQAFLPVAERSQLIVEIDRWVLRAALRQLHEWSARFGAGAPVALSVNFSGRHVVRPDAAEHAERVMAEFGVRRGQLTVEVTETSLVEDADSAALTLSRLRDLGVRLALDDFGTGYSSLSYLRSLPFDVLKIDRSFVQRVGESSPDRAIVQSVVGLARTLGLRVTAEGVETAEQEAVLRAMGCEKGQGFHFGRPLPPDEAAEWIGRSRAR